MKIAVVGLTNSGKTTIYNILTGMKIEATPYSDVSLHKKSVGIAKVIDSRIDYLDSIYDPKKKTYADVEFMDTPALFEKSSTALQDIKNSDALVLVVRGFENDEVLSTNAAIDPVSDINSVEAEMLLADLMVVENRISRIDEQIKKSGRKELLPEKKLFEKLKALLEEGKLLRECDFSDEENKLLSGFQLVSFKPVLVVVNTDENRIGDTEYEDGILDVFKNRSNLDIVFIPGDIEMEIKELDSDDAAEFMKDYGLTESGLDTVIRKSFELLGLICFFTVGKDEVRSWSIPKGITIQSAAGVIHSDLEKGFIRAEVTGYMNFHKFGNMPAVKEAGLQQLEGKEYIVRDGDIVNVRFNV